MIEDYLPSSHSLEPRQVQFLQPSFEALSGAVHAGSDDEKALLTLTLVDAYTEKLDLGTIEQRATLIYKNCLAPLERILPEARFRS